MAITKNMYLPWEYHSECSLEKNIVIAKKYIYIFKYKYKYINIYININIYTYMSNKYLYCPFLVCHLACYPKWCAHSNSWHAHSKCWDGFFHQNFKLYNIFDHLLSCQNHHSKCMFSPHISVNHVKITLFIRYSNFFFYGGWPNVILTLSPSLYIYIYIPRTQLTSIFEGQPSKRKP